MLTKVLFVLLTPTLIVSSPAFAQDVRYPEKLFSPYAAEALYDLGCSLYLAPDANVADCDIALALFSAAISLDDNSDYVLPDIIKLTSKFPDQDYSNAAYFALQRYLDENSDIHIAASAVRYLLDLADSREIREAVLSKLLNNMGNKNDTFASELATQLALLAGEKADLQSEVSLLSQAYRANYYNKLAFAKLNELAPQAITPTAYLRNLRFAMTENPFSLDNCLKFAQTAESLGLYKLAAQAYQYAAELFAYLYPSQPLAASIYLPWTIACYNDNSMQHKCLEIAETVKRAGFFDPLAQALAARAALKLGLTDQAGEIFTAIDRAANQIAQQDDASQSLHAQKFAWFYSFASPDPNKALDWANKAYAASPESPLSAAVLAYALMMKNQSKSAKPLITDLYENNQIAAIAMAKIELQEKNKGRAIELLKSAVAMDPGSLEAEHAKNLLQASESEYILAVDSEAIIYNLQEQFGKPVIPKFAPPNQLLAFKLTTNTGTTFSYDNKVQVALAITNNSSGPLVISDDAPFKGNIRLDAEITGDLSLKISNLVNKRIKPSQPIEPGRSALIPLKVFTGPLQKAVRRAPQADLQITLTAYLDPIVIANGSTRNAIPDIEPPTLTLRHSPVHITTRFLQTRLEYLSSGSRVQKIKSATLCARLLEEHFAVKNGLARYDLKPQEPALLKSALLRAIADENWLVRLHTMASIVDLPAEYALVRAVSANLYDEKWPVRLIAIFLLARSQGPDFKKVLDSIAGSDDNPVVRQLAVALGGEAPPDQPDATTPAINQPLDQPATAIPE